MKKKIQWRLGTPQGPVAATVPAASPKVVLPDSGPRAPGTHCRKSMMAMVIIAKNMQQQTQRMKVMTMSWLDTLLTEDEVFVLLPPAFFRHFGHFILVIIF